MRRDKVRGITLLSVVREERSTSDTEPTRPSPRRRARPTPPERTLEQVWHLPGKVPIRQVRALRQLQRDRCALFSRFMVGRSPHGGR